jgi:hypothetical protein
MKSKRVREFASIIVCEVVFVLGVHVLEAQVEPTRRHEAHEHGVAQLNVATQGAELYLEFVSPAANIVGFEHPPRTDEQRAAVQEAVEILKDGEALIVLPAGAECRLAESMIDTDIDSDPSSEPEGAHQHEHHATDEHQRHSEFTAEYRFVCKQSQKLGHMDVMLFHSFPGIERIEVQLLTGTKQAALELTVKKNRIPF